MPRDIPNGTQKFLLVLMAIAIPPLPIFLLSGPEYTIMTQEFVVTLILTFLGHVPGVLFAVYYILWQFPQEQVIYSRQNGYTSIPEPSEPRYRDEEEAPIAPQPAGLAVQEQSKAPQQTLPDVIEGSSDHPPPQYDDVVSPEEQKTIDAKSAGDNKVQR